MKTRLLALFLTSDIDRLAGKDSKFASPGTICLNASLLTGLSFENSLRLFLAGFVEALRHFSAFKSSPEALYFHIELAVERMIIQSKAIFIFMKNCGFELVYGKAPVLSVLIAGRRTVKEVHYKHGDAGIDGILKAANSRQVAVIAESSAYFEHKCKQQVHQVCMNDHFSP